MSSRHMTAYTARQLFDGWLSGGLIAKDDYKQLEDFTLSQQLERELPLYLRILVGIGAFIASICFIAFLGVAKLINLEMEASWIVWGIIFIAGALLFAFASSDKARTIQHSFLIQISFCSMATGKTLFVAGVALLLDPYPGWGITLATLLVTLATYHVYNMAIDRFLSSLAVLNSLFFTLTMEHIPFGAEEPLINVFFIVQLAAAAILMTHGKVRRDYLPLGYALIASLCIVVVHFAMTSQIGRWGHHYDFSPATINIALTVALVALIGWAAGNIAKLTQPALLMASLAAAVLGIVSAPGILLSIGLVILGYAKHDRLLLVTGALLFPVFLFFYYYNLDLTLMAKSGILVASGALLLAGRAYMHFRGLDKET